MKRLLVILTLTACCALIAAAQSETDPLPAGLYEAESTTLQPQYTGAWVQVVDGAYSILESETVDDSVTLFVSGSQLVIYRELMATGGATAEICIDGVCGTFANSSSTDQRMIPVAYAIEDGSEVTITNSDGGLLRLDSFLVIAPQPELTDVPAPDPARQYYALADGTLAAYDRTLTGGEELQIYIGIGQIVLLLCLVVVFAWRK